MMNDKDQRGIRQRAGFIAAATQHSARHNEGAKKAAAEGNAKRAAYHTTRAADYDRKIVASANNIKKIIDRD